jgi:hypothetical protein
MTRARFIGDPRHDGEGPSEITLLGLSFVKGEWAPVNASVYVKLATHSHFEVDADTDGEADPSVGDMRALLTERGVKFHHKAGPAKLAALLRGSDV